jgi:uncharacterized protein
MTMDFIRLEKKIIKKLRQELSRELYYHRAEHSIRVVKDVAIIGQAEGVTKDELILVKTAALLHDAGFLECPCLNEPLACEIAEKILPKYNYTPEQIKLVNGMILATAIPQKPESLLQEIICDADLTYLGKGDVKPQAENLRQEMELVLNRTFTNLEWIDFQLDFLRAHCFFTPYARKHLNPGKAEYVESLVTEKQILEGK